MNSTRIAFLALLTVCMFSLVDFFKTGFWIFPFPIYKTGLFILIVCMLVAEKKRPGITGILALCWSGCFVLTSRFFLQIFLEEEAIERLRDHLAMDYLVIAGLLLLLAWGLLFSLETANRLLKIVNCIFAVCFGICLMLNLYDIAIVPLLCWTTGIFLAKRKPSANEGVLVLLTFIYASSWIMGYYAASQLQYPSPGESGTSHILRAM